MLTKTFIAASFVAIGSTALLAISDGVAQSIIAAVSVAVASLIGVATAFVQLKNKVIDNQREADLRADARAAAADSRMQEMQREAQNRALQQDEKNNQMSSQIKEVHVATNGLTQKLSDAIEAEALGRGRDTERARALAEKNLVDAQVAKVATSVAKQVETDKATTEVATVAREEAAVARGGAEERHRSDVEKAALNTEEHTKKATELLESIDEKTPEPKGKPKP